MSLRQKLARRFKLPFWPIAKVQLTNETAELYCTGWVKITGKGGATDALPVMFCSQSLLDRFEAELTPKEKQPCKI